MQKFRSLTIGGSVSDGEGVRLKGVRLTGVDDILLYRATGIKPNIWGKTRALLTSQGTSSREIITCYIIRSQRGLEKV